jgi:hypothetical protein
MLAPFITLLNNSLDNPDVDTTRNTQTQEMISSLLQVILVKIGHTLD